VVTAYTLQGSSEVWSSHPPIGRPISNTQIYILDANAQPVPIGVTGEIFIGGVGVARGYLHRPELTAERFRLDPFSPDPENRMYKTGDFGHWRRDGSIVYQGRNDHQVKLRGHRIELGEIEGCLTSHHEVQAAAVMLREDSPGVKHIVAYIATQSLKVTVAELRGLLRRFLPEYMVPAAFVLLQALPVTPNGKVDRQALPTPDGLFERNQSQRSLPRTVAEQTIAHTWSSVLTIDGIGLDENFFDIGGHSMLAAQVVARIRETFQVDFTLRAFFTDATISGNMAELIRLLGTVDVCDETASLFQFTQSLSDEELDALLSQHERRPAAPPGAVPYSNTVATESER
jgi:hypothetical protein